MKPYIFFVTIALAMCLAACSGGKQALVSTRGATRLPETQPATSPAPPTATTVTPSPAPPGATPTSTPNTTHPASGASATSSPLVDPALAAQLANNCNLLNSQDLASILVTGELVKEPVKAEQADHPRFSDQAVSTREVTCVFYEFHNPGKGNEELLQVTYWLDLPGEGVSAADWAQAWAAAAQAGQAVSGLSSPAFSSGTGQLRFKQGGLYFSLEIVDTSRSAAQIDDFTRQIAEDMLQHLSTLPGGG